ncbi:uncharacterized protein LOC144445549 [Glandiceps talaboti]
MERMSVCVILSRRRKYLGVFALFLVCTVLCNITWYFAMSYLWNGDDVRKLVLRELRKSKGVIYTSSLEETSLDYFYHQTTLENKVVSMTTTSRKEERVNYLVPILLGNQGPNNQLQSLKLSAVIAAHRDRVLVRTPFFDHFTNKKDHARLFNETLDVRLFNKLLPTASIEEYNRHCNGRIDAVFNGANWSNDAPEEVYKKTIKWANDKMKEWAQHTGIQVPDMLSEPDRVINLPDDVPDGYKPLRKVINKEGMFDSSLRCVGIVYPYGLLGRFYYHDYVPVLSGYVTRPPEVRKLAGQVIRHVLDRRRYLCFHWRYNKEWRDQWCFKNSPKQMEMCRRLNNTDSNTITDVVQDMMDVSNLEVVYLATPVSTQDKLVIELLRKIPNLYTRDDVLESPLMAVHSKSLSRDNYKLSLLEQEICSRSTVFLASRMSSWSTIVDEDRKNRDVIYVPDVLLKNKTSQL